MLLQCHHSIFLTLFKYRQALPIDPPRRCRPLDPIGRTGGIGGQGNAGDAHERATVHGSDGSRRYMQSRELSYSCSRSRMGPATSGQLQRSPATRMGAKTASEWCVGGGIRNPGGNTSVLCIARDSAPTRTSQTSETTAAWCPRTPYMARFATGYFN